LESVRNLDAYVFRAFAREIRRHVATESKLVGIEYAGQISDPGDHALHGLLIRELKAMMDDNSRLLFERRLAGYSWDEIGRDLGIDAHAAEQRFYRGLRKLCAKVSTPTVLGKVREDGSRSQSPGEQKTQMLNSRSQKKRK
jgi:DNA-directed RNA polymerase specialized sigma24 family protein